MKETRYLVTGGAGFIGANFVKYILKEYGDSVRVLILDSLTYAGNLATLADELNLPNVEFVKGDINDIPLVDSLFERLDPHYVVNFAAESHVDRSIENPRLFLETNVLGTQTLLDAASKHWRNENGSWKTGRRFLQISTDEVYGSLTRDYNEPRPVKLSETLSSIVGSREDVVTYGERMFTEMTPIAPRSPYSASKASADMLVMAYSDTYGLPVNITRCSNNYGPWHFPEKLIPLIIKNIREGRELPVYGKGLNVRDWLYVGDHVRAVDMVLRKGRPGEIYNIGGLNEMENITIVKLIVELVAEMTGTEPSYELIRFVRDRAGHDMRYAIDASKAASELGWAPLTPFSKGLRQTVEWNLQNENWIKEVTSGEYRQYYDKMYKNR